MSAEIFIALAAHQLRFFRTSRRIDLCGQAPDAETELSLGHFRNLNSRHPSRSGTLNISFRLSSLRRNIDVRLPGNLTTSLVAAGTLCSAIAAGPPGPP